MTTQDRPMDAAAKPPSRYRAALKIGLIGGLNGAVFSGLISYTIGHIPDTVVANSLSQATTALFSGFFSGFIGLLIYLRR